MSVVGMAIYKPKAGKREPLLKLLKRHRAILRKAGLISTKHAYVMASENGTLVEVFEWVSPQAKVKAHHNEAWRSLWPHFEALCTYGTLNRLPESRKLFPNFWVV